MFIVADAATFAALLFAYGYVRVANPDWTRPFAFWPSIANAIVMTVILLTSSLTMIGAVLAAKAGSSRDELGWLVATYGMGTLFDGQAVRACGWVLRAGWRLCRF